MQKYLVSTMFSAVAFSSLKAAKRRFYSVTGPVTLFQCVDGQFVRVARRRKDSRRAIIGDSPALYSKFRKRGYSSRNTSATLLATTAS